MRILSIVSNPATHDPRVYNEAVSLSKGGHDVTILGWDRKKTEKEKENVNGIKIIRVRNTKFMDLIPYDIIKLPFWWNIGYKKAMEIHREEKFEAVHCHDLDTLPIGVKIKKKLKIPLIYDAHEIWGYMISNDVPDIIWRFFLKKEKKYIRNVNHVITVNEPLKEYFSSIFDGKITIIMNAKPLQKKVYSPPKNNVFTLVYIGTLIRSRFILEMIDVIKNLHDVKLIIGGKGKKEFVEEILKRISSSENIEFLGVVPYDEVIPITCKADAVICMMSPQDRNNRLALANKQFEAMVCGRPIIATENTYSGEFTKKNGIGITVNYSKEDFRKGIIYLRDNPDISEKMGKKAFKMAIEGYNWEAQETKLLDIYKHISEK